MTRDLDVLEQRLDDFDPAIRRDTLAALIQLFPRRFSLPRDAVNMHCHSFFSYNACGYSPTRILWEAHKQGLHAVGLCDFDVLDGLEEFLNAGRQLGMRTAVYLETRAFLSEYAKVDISSPGENGVIYIMGGGFFEPPRPASAQAATLNMLRDAARARNETLIERINAQLDPVRIGYAREVLPATPRGCATERHIVSAYIAKARKVLVDEPRLESFWARVLSAPQAQIKRWLQEGPLFEDKVRAALVKRGGLGYVAPSPQAFPPAETFIQWVRSCGAIPLITWLDGTSDGEKKCRPLLECLSAKGCGGLNIIPDRNWNLKDPEEKARKVRRLNEVVREAVRMNLPVNIGTEMNKSGQPFADDLDGPVLSRHREVFLEGAHIFVGHTLLSRYAERPYPGPRAESEWPDVSKRNAFYAAVGALPPLSAPMSERLEGEGPQKALTFFREAVKTGMLPDLEAS